MAEPEIFFFAGPSLWQRGTAPFRDGRVRILPPCRPGDLAVLAESHARPRAIGLVDLDFHRPPALPHHEILAAIGAGWQLWGLAGLGAARGAELRELGMRGFGRVFERFRRSSTFGDDEAICLHGAEAPYRAASEPLVHLREALSWLVAGNALERRAARRVAGVLEQMWFGDRTIEVFNELLKERKVDAGTLGEMDRRFADFRLQRKDIDRFLAASPWRSAATAVRECAR